MKQFLFVISLCSVFLVKAQPNINIVPMPVEIKPGKGNFILTPNTTIVLEGSGLENSVAFLNDYFSRHYGFTLKTSKDKKNNNAIVLNFERMDFPLPGAYTMDINDKEIYIAGDNEAGVFYGIQTLIQLLPATKKSTLPIPQLYINDHPRFAWRGMHLDVARHFFSVAYVKKYIDYLALHKFNTFHWHLTDDQGWRIEIKKYPKLTEVGSCRNQTLVGRYGSDQYDSTIYCGYYTQKEIKEIVKYATARYITIIPEIDMPGHCVAALTAYPFLGCTKGPYKVMETWGVASDVLCAGNDSSYVFIQDVLDEVMQLFSSEYIHIGGDECPKEKWKTCPVCQQRMKDEKLKDEHELQSYFTRRIEKYVNSKGRKIMGWDEILEGGLAPNAAIMSWRGESGGITAAKQNHYVVMSPENPFYINHSQTRNEDSVTQGQYNPIENVYNYDPVPKDLNEKQAAYILGGQGNLWSEYLDNEKKLEYMLFPRISAVAEVLWSPKQKRNWPDFEKRLPGILERYKFLSINYSTAYYDLQPTVIPSGKNEIRWKLESRNKDGQIIYVLDSNINASLNYNDPLLINKTGLYGAALTNNEHKIISNWIWQHFYLNHATGKKITLTTEPNKNYSLGGAFTLVDGIQNEKGMLRSAQFLGFNGKDLEAIIDLGENKNINEIVLHAFEQKGSWIYKPASVSFYKSDDGQHFSLIESPVNMTGTKNLLYKISTPLTARFIKVVAKNNGTIATGEPGGGNNAWLFVDEIEVNE
ncbi:MAG: family 20 glycosylhydrolase [Ferruginibacter sp.]